MTPRSALRSTLLWGLTLPAAGLLLLLIQADSRLGFVLLLALLAAGVAGLRRVIRLQADLQRQADQTRALVGFSGAMRANQNLDVLLQTVYRQLHVLLGVEYFTAALGEADGQRLTYPLVVRAGQIEEQPGLFERQAQTPLDYVLRTQKPLVLAPDARQSAVQLGLLPPAEPVRIWMGAPLMVAGRAFGVLAIGTARSEPYLEPDAQHILNFVAAAASVAIDNAQLYEQQAARAVQLGSLNTVLSLLTETLAPDEVLDTVISSASAVSEATAVAVYRLNEGTFTLVGCAGLSEDFHARPTLRLNPVSQVGESDQPVLVEDALHDPRAAQARLDVVRERKMAWVELPLIVGGYGIGAIILYFDTPQRFTPESVELLRTFANQAAQAIQNADLYTGTYRALENRIEQLSALAALGRDLMATTDPAMISQRLLQAAREATAALAGAVVLWDAHSERWTLAAEWGYPPGTFNNPALLDQGITGRALRTGQVIHTDRAPAEADYLPLLPQARAQMTVPLLRQGQPLGALTLENVAAFTSDQAEFVAQLAIQGMLAFENARLFDAATESRDRMQAILNTMTEALILIDRTGRIALANPRVDLLGLEARDLIGRPLEALLDNTSMRLAERLGCSSDHELLRLVRALRGPVVRAEQTAYALHSSSAPRYIQRQLIPVRDEPGEVIGLLLVFNDITERHNLERAREEFSQMVIHDLRSPLTAVTSSIELLTEIMPPDNEFSALVVKTAGSSKRAIRKLLNRVDSLLDISRMKSGQMSLHLEVAELPPLVEAARAELAALARDLDVTIAPQIPADLPRLLIDVDKVERVLLNLVDNALKFSPRDSAIVIRAQQQANWLCVQVIDRGPGVPESERQSIFDRFVQIQHQAGRQRRGSGLGLNFCKLAVEAHGGRIWIDDNPEGGSIFMFTLPVAGEQNGVQLSG
jgi:PAS domain S-box-containing protein